METREQEKGNKREEAKEREKDSTNSNNSFYIAGKSWGQPLKKMEDKWTEWKKQSADGWTNKARVKKGKAQYHTILKSNNSCSI